MSRENYDDIYDQEDRRYYAAEDPINSELMEKKDPAINQHEDTSDRTRYRDEDSYESTDKRDFEDENKHLNKDNDTSDPFFQKNAPIAQDLDDELKDDDDDNDADRRTLDESKADEDEEDY
ncbi:hypothetical protein [Flavobacterium gelatinilyticum]|uniref:hypothetical protein n=1 Tax=Flavobacterium gelatinilyticum TaxID=3003260 RepID=UPI0024803CAA|nr:hypothetical protein [Flavobacterium gelatinilyticum]